MIIKKSSEDFVVEEIPDFTSTDQGDYSVYKLRKVSMNTEQAIEILCKRFNILRKNIKYAGAKDRNAVTTQYISIKARNRLSIDEKNLRLEFLCYSDQPLSLGSLKGNRFDIIVRDLIDDEIKNFLEKTKYNIKNNIKNNIIMPNYFDEQRFSANNFDVGLCILRKDFRKASESILKSEGRYEDIVKKHLESFPNDYVGAIRTMPKKIISMYVHSVQSLLFNNALAQVLKEYAGINKTIYRELKYNNGQFVFYQSLEDYDKVLVEELQLVGFDTNMMNKYISEDLKSLAIDQRDFIIKAIPELSVEGSTRRCFAELQDFSYENIDDKTIRLKFALPKASYATIAVKMLFC